MSEYRSQPTNTLGLFCRYSQRRCSQLIDSYLKNKNYDLIFQLIMSIKSRTHDIESNIEFSTLPDAHHMAKKNAAILREERLDLSVPYERYIYSSKVHVSLAPRRFSRGSSLKPQTQNGPHCRYIEFTNLYKTDGLYTKENELIISNGAISFVRKTSSALHNINIELITKP